MGGCFRGCFGSSSKDIKNLYHRKFKILPREQRSGSCEPLQSRFYPEQDIKAKLVNQIAIEEDKHEEQLSLIIRKKSTFDAVVKTHEPVLTKEGKHGDQLNLSTRKKEDAIVNSDEPVSVQEDKHEVQLSISIQKKVTFDANVKTYEPIPVRESSEDFAEDIQEIEKQEEKLEKPTLPCYPSNHRYDNCQESDDEVDEFESMESYTDDEDSEYGEEDEFKSDDESMSGTMVSQEINNLDMRERKTALPGANVQDRGIYVHPVLNPVENLAQWKTLKTNRQFKKQNQEVAVDASLSNWLVSTDDRSILGSSTSPRRSPSRSPDEMFMTDGVGIYHRSYLGSRVKDIGSAFSYKSLPNTTRSKYQQVLVK